MGKKFSKLLGIFLALAMILTAIPGNAFAAGNNSGEGTLQPGDTRIPVTVKMTLNKVYDWNDVNGSVAKGIAVKGDVQFYWVYTDGAAPVFENANIDGTTSNVKWIEGSETVFFKGLPDKVGNVTVADYTKLSLVALLSEDHYDLNHPVNAAEIAEPSIENPYVRGQQVYKLGEVKFDAEGKVVKDTNMIVRDFAVSFRNARFGETVITVFDKVTRKPLKGVQVVISNVKVDGDKYVMTNDAGMNYIDTGDDFYTSTEQTDDNGQIFLDAATKQAIAAVAANDVVAVKAQLSDSGYAYTSVSFLSLKTPLDQTETPNTSYISLFLSNAAPAPFEVRVRYQDGTKPYAAAAGITVKVLSNESKIFGETKMGEAVFTGKTDENGYVEIPAAALTNSTEVYLNENDNTQLNPRNLERKNFIVLYDENGKELASSPAVPYMVTDEDIANNFKDFTFTTGSRLPFGRLAGSNRFETAVSVAKEQYPDGLTGNVIIARADDFADCLTANGLAYVFDAPILLTATNELSKETAAYLEAHNDEIKNVIVMGLTNAIDGQVSKKLESIGRVVRVGGDNRFETAISAADMIMNAKNGSVDTAELGAKVSVLDRSDMGTFFLANGWNFPDALIASVPAARYGYPILLTDKAPLTKVTRDYLSAKSKAGEAKRVVVFGGEDVIAENTKATIDVSTVSRIAGKSRYETNTKANTILFADVTKLYVVSGTRYSDALVAGKLAAENNAGVLMVNPNGLDKETIEYLKNSKVTDFILVGGEDVIPTKVAEQIFDVIAGR